MLFIEHVCKYAYEHSNIICILLTYCSSRSASSVLAYYLVYKLWCSPRSTPHRDLHLPQRSLLEGYGFTASSDMLCFYDNLHMWECLWTDNAAVQQTAAWVWSEISHRFSEYLTPCMFRPACPMGRTSTPLIWEAYWTLMQVMTQ